MKTTFFSAALAAAFALVSALATPSFAQMQTNPAGAGFGQAPSAGGPGAGMGAARPNVPSVGGSQLGVNGIAVVDVAYIFKNYAKFKQQMEGMKGKVDLAETALKKDGEDIKKMNDQMNAFAQGSAERKKLEADLLKRSADFQLNKTVRQKEFMEMEGQLYFNVSREIDMVVKQLATQNGIVLVMKFNGEPVDANDHQDILRGINKPIVYYDQRMDITPNVLDQLNRGAVGTGNVGVRMPQPGGAQPPR